MKKLLIIFLLFAATASANVIRPVEPSAAENNMVRLSRIIIDPERLEEYNAYLKEEIEVLSKEREEILDSLEKGCAPTGPCVLQKERRKILGEKRLL